MLMLAKSITGTKGRFSGPFSYASKILFLDFMACVLIMLIRTIMESQILDLPIYNVLTSIVSSERKFSVGCELSLVR